MVSEKDGLAKAEAENDRLRAALTAIVELYLSDKPKAVKLYGMFSTARAALASRL